MNQPGQARPKVFQQLLSFVLAARDAFFSPTAGLQRTACVVVGQAHVGHMGREVCKEGMTSFIMFVLPCLSVKRPDWMAKQISLSLSLSLSV